MVNTALTPLDPKECETLPKSKMTKQLQSAWQIASENHDLDYFKDILKVWQEEQAAFERDQRAKAEEREKKAAEKAEREAEAAAKAADDETKGKKKKSRKSKGDEDVEMEDADAPKSSSKKRKKDAESDTDKVSLSIPTAVVITDFIDQPKKTPKVTKLNAPKTPNGETPTAKKSSAKPKKKVVQAPKEDEEDEKPQMTEAEKQQQREKAVLYLRHRLQKGFLSRDQAPQESEMAAMADFFSQLESYENLEPVIIRATKVHKVLKAIVKLASIPKDDEYNFKKRSTSMLEIWNKRMDAETESAPASAVEPSKPSSLPVEETKEPETNGEKAEETAKEEPETKEGAEMDVGEKAEEAAEQLDEKIQPASVEEKTEEYTAPDPPKEVSEEKVEPAGDAAAEAAAAIDAKTVEEAAVEA